MKSIFIVILLSSFAFAQREVILPFDSSDWAYTRALDQNNQQVDPALTDPDFWLTWLDQSVGNYSSPLNYDGPSFQTNQTAPFFAGNVPGIQSGTSLDLPANASWRKGYFLKVIDGGEFGFQNLDVKMLARDAAIILLNGQILTGTPNSDLVSLRGDLEARDPGDGITVLELPYLGFFPPETKVLRPGPNLLSIVTARVPEETEDFGFKIQITGEPGMTPISFVMQNLIENRLHLRWATAEPQKTIVKISNLTEGTTQIIEGDSVLRNHHFIRKFNAGTRIKYEVLKPDLQIWETNSATGTITTPDSVFIKESSSGWQILQSLDNQGFGINPALSDPDFHTTWFTFPKAGSIYDGPAFTPNQRAPVQIVEGNTGTILPGPGAEHSGAVYLVKEIDGPLTGSRSLSFNISTNWRYRLYLNGRLISYNIGSALLENDWSFYRENSINQPSVERSASFLPGKNIIAISLHPYDQNDLSLTFDMTLTGVEGAPEMAPIADPVIFDSTATITWFTFFPSASLLRHGPSRSEMINSINLPESIQYHEIDIPLPDPGERVYYEILKDNGASYEPPAINSFVNASPPITKPIISYPDDQQIRLVWRTAQPSTTHFRYGLEPDFLPHFEEDPELKIFHTIIPEQAIEAGNYTYEILATDSTGQQSTFRGTFEILKELIRTPFLQKAAPTSMTINWRTRNPGNTLVQFGQDPANLDQVISGTNSLASVTFSDSPNETITDHFATLTGLTPATKYYYQITSDNAPAPARDLEQFFTTPPLPGTPAPTRIWVIGDSGYAGPGVLSMKDAYLQYTGDTPTDVWLMLGDNAYLSGTDSQYQTSVFNTFPELLKNTPVWPTMGNHEGYSNQYYGIFDLPTDGVSGGIPSGTEKYYSFDHGNIHFICLNSEEDPPGMLDWLKTDLQSTRADWIIAFFHHGPYTKGSHDSDRESEHFRPRQSYLPILEDYGVDLVLSGHSHQYERSHLLNGHYFQSPSYSAEDHAIDTGPGSPLGHTDRNSGLFRYTSEYGPYQKPLATPNSGQVSATVGASSSVGSWSDTNGGNSQAITHPNPHPVHVATLRALGSMVIDVHDQTLQAYYLDANGQIRDHFEIQKSPDTGPAITWWQDHFGPGSYPRFPDWFADTDNDTHNNFAEYAHGGDPLAGDQLIEAVRTTEEDQNNQLRDWFTVQYKLREGTKVSVQASQNLVQFTASGIETRRLTQPDANGLARWEARVRRTNQRALFFRILVSR